MYQILCKIAHKKNILSPRNFTFINLIFSISSELDLISENLGISDSNKNVTVHVKHVLSQEKELPQSLDDKIGKKILRCMMKYFE